LKKPLFVVYETNIHPDFSNAYENRRLSLWLTKPLLMSKTWLLVRKRKSRPRGTFFCTNMSTHTTT